MKHVTIGICFIFFAGFAYGQNEKDPVKSKIEAASTLMKVKQWDEAKTILESIFDGNEDNREVVVGLARCEEGLKNSGKACELYKKSLELANGDDNFSDSKEGKLFIDKCKKTIVKLDEGKAVLLKYAEEMEKEAEKLKEKNKYAYDEIMIIVEEIKGEKEEIVEKKDAKEGKRNKKGSKISGKWDVSGSWSGYLEFDGNSVKAIDGIGNNSGIWVYSNNVINIKWNSGGSWDVNIKTNKIVGSDGTRASCKKRD
ncbi:MAG: hypothetical protein AABY32_02460 [Nanoarchaeota archaeon]